MMTNEWVGPRCIRKRNSRSISGRTEVANSNGKCKLTLTSFEDAFPVRYPKAKWPIANVAETSNYIALG